MTFKRRQPDKVYNKKKICLSVVDLFVFECIIMLSFAENIEAKIEYNTNF